MERERGGRGGGAWHAVVEECRGRGVTVGTLEVFTRWVPGSQASFLQTTTLKGTADDKLLVRERTLADWTERRGWRVQDRRCACAVTLAS